MLTLSRTPRGVQKCSSPCSRLALLAPRPLPSQRYTTDDSRIVLRRKPRKPRAAAARPRLTPDDLMKAPTSFTTRYKTEESRYFATRSRKWWFARENVRAFLDSFMRLKEINKPEDFYDILHKDVKQAGGQRALKIYGGTVGLAQLAFPEFKFYVWLFKYVPQGFWTDPKNHSAYMDWLGERLGYKSMEDWYQIQLADFYKNSGSYISFMFRDSPILAIQAAFPDYEWKPWLFSKHPAGLFRSVKARQEYIRWLMQKTGKDMNYLSKADFLWNSGTGLYLQYGGSVQKVLESLREEGDVVPEGVDLRSVGTKPRNYWASLDNQRMFMESLAEKIGFSPKDLSNWYHVPNAKIASLGGSGILKRYLGSRAQLLKAIYPEFDWVPWKFTQASRNSLSKTENISSAIKFAEKALGLSDIKEWYRVSAEQLDSLEVRKVFEHNGGLFKTLKLAYPDVEWNFESNEHSIL